GCNHPECPLEAAIVVPLRVKNDVIGTLKLYFTNRHDVSHSDKQLASGLAEIFSSQLELGQAETQSALVRDAEIKSLQAQVNPHFFFNAINTISALVRIDSEKARKLLLQLSQFFRSNYKVHVTIRFHLKRNCNKLRLIYHWNKHVIQIVLMFHSILKIHV